MTSQATKNESEERGDFGIRMMNIIRKDGSEPKTLIKINGEPKKKILAMRSWYK